VTAQHPRNRSSSGNGVLRRRLVEHWQLRGQARWFRDDPQWREWFAALRDASDDVVLDGGDLAAVGVVGWDTPGLWTLERGGRLRAWQESDG
jgi:hypothetical protein